jgi:hypothetical protein
MSSTQDKPLVQTTNNTNVEKVNTKDLVNEASENSTNAYNELASTIALQNVDPINSSKTSIYVIFILGIAIPLVLFLISLKFSTLKSIIIIYVGLYLLGMSIWYLIYSIHQYRIYRNKFKDTRIKLNLKLKI